MNYYNEIELTARRWLRELIKDGLIPDGYIDNRPIQEIKASELRGFTQCHFFAGIGGWPYALRIAGVPDDEPIWTGSCPCQPFSDAGDQVGFSDPRHLFPTWRRLIARCGPSVVFGEQVASKLGREWLARVRIEMATLGYATRAADLCSAGVTSPNRRQRLFWMADTEGARRLRNASGTESSGRGAVGGDRSDASVAMADGDCSGLQGRTEPNGDKAQPGQQTSRRADSMRRDPVGALGDAVGLGREEPGNGRASGKEISTKTGEEIGAAGRSLSSFWEKHRIVRCEDGKSRRIPSEPALYPLASRLPGDMGIIRGAGNAINPWVAAKFIIDTFA